MSIPSIRASANVTTAIAAASQKTGIDFNYLLGQAQVESGMRSNARARTSSAARLPGAPSLAQAIPARHARPSERGEADVRRKWPSPQARTASTIGSSVRP